MNPYPPAKWRSFKQAPVKWFVGRLRAEVGGMTFVNSLNDFFPQTDQNKAQGVWWEDIIQGENTKPQPLKKGVRGKSQTKSIVLSVAPSVTTNDGDAIQSSDLRV